MKCPTHRLDAVHVPYVAHRSGLAGLAAVYAPFWCCPLVTCTWEAQA